MPDGSVYSSASGLSARSSGRSRSNSDMQPSIDTAAFVDGCAPTSCGTVVGRGVEAEAVDVEAAHQVQRVVDEPALPARVRQVERLGVDARDVARRVAAEPLGVLVGQRMAPGEPADQNGPKLTTWAHQAMGYRSFSIGIDEVQRGDVRDDLVEPVRVRTGADARDRLVHDLAVDDAVHQDVEDDVHAARMAGLHDAPDVRPRRRSWS